MPSAPRSTEARILACLLRIAPYATTAVTAFNDAVLRQLRQRGLIVIDTWGVVSLTRRGEAAALGLI